ncbi:chemotaxis protein CheD [Texcoconibacillus texcoconensis]|uniref:Probable chemoreceptor glutamine deamidase CheD n=1 Tax=Texcoconibacillus texcoconensis TaxID=1095777 RepID=A0A840QKS6_9BACI|nr:chemotaxis protein CheD [Texcoconibacillus texcoconensis]MBB5172053.1 chemotaxis protein CheD [Texcoconibacillus texcoconensis]
MNEVVKVGMADLNVSKSPNSIRTSGLGSCVGVVIYDERMKLAGMAHIMLPDSSMAKNGGLNRAKYADTAITDLLVLMEREGANKIGLKAKMAGGAQMFQFSSSSEVMRIGPRNVEAVREQLKKHKIQLISEDVGGNSGRTIEFDPASFSLSIRTVSQGTREI